MATNTYLPHVGGVAQGVNRYARGLREIGHEVKLVAPRFPGVNWPEKDLTRVPGFTKLLGSEFSYPAMTTRSLTKLMRKVGVGAKLVHSNQPFGIGDAALRLARDAGVPCVFTHWTLYEHYVQNFIPQSPQAMQNAIVKVATDYANACDASIAPSGSARQLMLDAGVRTPVHVVPGAVDIERFACGNRKLTREFLGIDSSAFVVGHVGRLSKEKGLPLLGRAMEQFLSRAPRAHFLVVGTGNAEDELKLRLGRFGSRVHFVGVQKGARLANAYAAMDTFAFTSKSETQGLVLVEAMASGCPVVGIDAPGVRDVVVSGRNGLLLSADVAEEQIAAALLKAQDGLAASLRRGASDTAAQYDIVPSARRLEQFYRAVLMRRN